MAKYARHHAVSLYMYQIRFTYMLLLLGPEKSIVIPQRLRYIVGLQIEVPRYYKNDRDVIYVSTSFPGPSPLFKMAGGRICRQATSEIVKEKVDDCPLLIPGAPRIWSEI